MDDFAARVILDSQEQGKKAAERGKSLHEAIENYIQGKLFDSAYSKHVLLVEGALKEQCGLDLIPAQAEKTFATSSFGGKIDWKKGLSIADFKTKERIDNKKVLAYDNHVMQLAAYAVGSGIGINPSGIYLSIFIGVEDENVAIYSWTIEDIERGWKLFSYLLSFWLLSRDFGKLVHEH